MTAVRSFTGLIKNSMTKLGFNSLICEDACATYTQRAHEDALLMHARMFGEVDTAERVISKMA